jgi:hypothetical protein
MYLFRLSLAFYHVSERPAEPLQGNNHFITVFKPDASVVTQARCAEKMYMYLPGYTVLGIFEMMVFQIVQAVCTIGFSRSNRHIPKHLPFPFDGDSAFDVRKFSPNH